MKLHADKKRQDVQYAPGDWVYVRLKPHKQQSVAHRVYPKLSARFFGPYQVENRIGSVAYRLKLLATSKVHPVFHVSLLKKAIGAQSSSTTLPPELELDPTETTIPEKILATCTIQRDDESVSQWLV